MGKGKLLIVGVVFGILAIFAFIGVKSMLGDRKLVTQDTGYAPILPEGTGTPITGTGADTATGTGTLPNTTSPSTNPNLTTQDIALPGNTTNPSETITLEGEQQETPTNPNTSTTQAPAGQLNAGTTASSTGTSTNVTATTGTPTPTNTPTSTTTTVPADSTTTTTMTEPTPTAFGKLGLTIVDLSSPNGEIDGEFLVYDTDGVQVASYSGSETTNFSLPPGKYLAKVKANGKEASRLLEVYADKLTNARFEMPTSSASTTTTPQQQAQTNPVASNANGQIFISVRAAEGNRSIRSNIYVQKQNGQHVAKSNYVDGAEFSLEPGSYKITVKSEGRQEATRNIQVSANGIVRENIVLNAVGNVPVPPQQAQQTVQVQPPPQQQVQQGLLRLRLNTGEGLPDQARFVIRNRAGERVATVGPAPNGEINLPAGTYEVTAGIQGLRQSRMIEIGNGRVSEISFDATEIIGQNSMPLPVPPLVEPVQQGGQVPQQESPQQAPAQQNGGRLNLYAISGIDRKPMRVNFTVMTLQGQPIQSFTNVSSAEIRVPPQPVQVRINYQSMSGTEVINISPDQPTEYTFTISPTN
ncbi:hypothetical protein [uncultured Thiothrix sp.]|uniref:hypothetical protein n=1 Tax=uncultured Thiothrix sp. TaxID=223185 RepID=UPI0026019D04|nr:hypothetical protein [uncultured Thiothrix sp.]